MLLNIDANAKTVKGRKKGYMTGILYLAPHTLAGPNLCPNASPGCIATCLNTAGRGRFTSVQKARIAKTNYLRSDRVSFMSELVKDITSLVKKAKKARLTPVVRLNGTSDLPWENMGVMDKFPKVQFYDYTKSPERMARWQMGLLPANYHLTFSRSECNNLVCEEVLSFGGNVAIVFSTPPGDSLPKTWGGYPVIDGDLNDLRFLDRNGVIVGLRAKGKARKDATGFVVQV